ncbi:hypothetical protein [Methanobrevibacter sp. YE315]|uniref:Ppx/GppA phosphatase family protein n=1 Tax=Methanobrevibacter sp. YE315 TaxID=1609968 RepID=UPI00082D1CB5|nr:hypothetical protein [Methanobrevibacter sp. YE315]
MNNIIMESRKFGILIIFILSILTISCVSAEDLNNTDSVMLSQDLNQSVMLHNSDMDNETILASGSNVSETLSEPPSAQNNKPEGIYGIVDFGSNVIGLNIYDVHNNEVTKKISLAESSVVSSYTQNNKLTPEGIEKLISILEYYSEVMQSNGVIKDYVFATASLRKIDNPDEVVTAVKNRLGIDIHVISGEKEAELGFKAVKEMDLTNDNGLYIDLGGGSCEIIYFVNRNPSIVASMPFGSNSAYNEFVNGTFPNETERLNIQNMTLSELKKLDIKNTNPINDLYGTGGTVYATKLMLNSLGFINEDETVIPVSMLDELLDNIKDDTEENRQKIIDVVPSRLNTLIPGIIIVKTILEYYNMENLHYCTGQIDDAVLFELLENESSKDVPVDPSSENVSSNSSSEIVKVSSKIIANPTGNPIAMLVLVLFSLVISCRKR